MLLLFSLLSSLLSGANLPTLHKTSWGGRQGQEDLWSQQTSVSFRVSAKFSISSWVDRTLVFDYSPPPLPPLQRSEHAKSPVRSLNGLNLDICGSGTLQSLLRALSILPLTLSVFPHLTLSCSLLSCAQTSAWCLTEGQRCTHRHNNKSLWETHCC